MIKAKKIISILLALTFVFTFAACKKENADVDFKTWFNSEFVTAYDAFVKTEYGNKNAPFPEISLMLTSSGYLNSVFEYIANGTQPEAAEITAADGVYTYKAQDFTQKVEFDNSTSAIRITSTMDFNGETKTNFVVTMREKDDVYYIQYLSSEFLTYHEVSFTASDGSVKSESRKVLPYSIFGEEIPESFAKES